MIRQMYDVVMNSDVNPFSALPKMVRFQYMMILSYLWSAVFTLWIGSYMVFGATVVGHTAVLVAIFFTADIFRKARAEARNHRDAMRDPEDGTVLYDDVWGAPQGHEPQRA